MYTADRQSVLMDYSAVINWLPAIPFYFAPLVAGGILFYQKDNPKFLQGTSVPEVACFISGCISIVSLLFVLKPGLIKYLSFFAHKEDVAQVIAILMSILAHVAIMYLAHYWALYRQELEINHDLEESICKLQDEFAEHSDNN